MRDGRHKVFDRFCTLKPSLDRSHQYRAALGIQTSISVETKLKHDVFFRSLSNHTLAESSSSLIALTIPTVLRAGINKPVINVQQTDFRESNLHKICDIYNAWMHKEFLNEPIQPAYMSTKGELIKFGIDEKVATDSRVGAFFSGGVDSFYSLIKNQNEITDLIFIHGMDIPLGDTNLRQQASSNIKEIAKELNKGLIELETNAIDYLNDFVKWGPYGHGACLASIAHLLTPHLGKVIIPSTHSYADLFPWGSHPLLDPLWSTASLEITHDGCEATRAQKVALIKDNPQALRYLRVCYKNKNSSYNCGRCEKCLRTMINLYVNDALHLCDTLPHELDAKTVQKIVAIDDNTISFVRENLASLRRDRNPLLYDALSDVASSKLTFRLMRRKLKLYIGKRRVGHTS